MGDKPFVTEDSYPYQEKTQDSCGEGKKAAKMKNYQKLNGVEEMMDSIMNYGSVAACVDAGDLSQASSNEYTFKSYVSGIYRGKCGTNVNHAVSLIGWGESNEGKYWILRNSFGASWGMGGYMHIARGENMCGIEQEVSAVTE